MLKHRPSTIVKAWLIATMILGWTGAGAGAADHTPPSDFNGDGRSDLAIGVPGEDVVHTHEAGTVNVLHGAARGLIRAGNQLWHQGLIEIEDDDEEDDAFGSALTTGDFNGDGYADLAIGVPNESVNGFSRAGTVNVLYGSIDGLSGLNDQLWHQDMLTVQDSAFFDDQFGHALAACDFNGDGYTDLAIGVPGEDAAMGAVNVLYGSLFGLTDVDNQFWSQDIGSVQGFGEVGDNFGFSLATGDFNGDDWCDLAIGAPGQWVDGAEAAGVAHVLHGAWPGLTDEGNQIWHQGATQVFHDRTLVISGHPDAYDNFGFSMTAGDFNGDGFSDLAVGVVGEDLESRKFNAGAVNVLYGFHEGLLALGNHMWHQDVPKIRDEAETDDKFGYSLASGDFDGDGYDDLAIGAPDEIVKRVIGAGAVNVLYGSAECLRVERNQLWSQDSVRIPESIGEWDMFGAALSTGDFDGDGYDDLVVGVPNETLGDGIFGAGAVHIIHGARRTGLTSAGTQLWHQGSRRILGRAEKFDGFGFALGSR